jgi:hypothetical protein
MQPVETMSSEAVPQRRITQEQPVALACVLLNQLLSLLSWSSLDSAYCFDA